MIVNLFIVAFLVLCLYGAKYKKSGFYSSSLSKDNTNKMKGIFDLAIILCHLSEINGVDNLYFFRGTGNLSVSMFLFLSGYGLMCSVEKNGTNEFIKKRFSSVFIPFVWAEIITFFFFANIPAVYGLTEDTYNVINLVKNFFSSGATLIIKGWYIFEILLLYVEFYLAFKIAKGSIKKGTIICTAFVVATTIFFAILTFRTSWISFWAYSTLAFAYGFLWKLYKNRIELFLKKHYFTYLGILSVLLCFTFFSYKIMDKSAFFANHEINTTFLSRYLTSPIFVLFVNMIAMKFKSDNKILDFLGSISYEVYLYHGLIYCLLRSLIFAYVESDFYYILITVALSIDIAYVFSKVNKTTRRVLRLS